MHDSDAHNVNFLYGTSTDRGVMFALFNMPSSGKEQFRVYNVVSGHEHLYGRRVRRDVRAHLSSEIQCAQVVWTKISFVLHFLSAV